MYDHMERMDTATREMVLDLAAEVANRVVAKVREAGLTDGHIEEHVDVGEDQWHIHCIYYTSTDQVQVSGHKCLGAHERPIAFTLFGPRAEAVEDEFDFTIPAYWLPERGEVS